MVTMLVYQKELFIVGRISEHNITKNVASQIKQKQISARILKHSVYLRICCDKIKVIVKIHVLGFFVAAVGFDVGASDGFLLGDKVTMVGDTVGVDVAAEGDLVGVTVTVLGGAVGLLDGDAVGLADNNRRFDVHLSV